MSRKRQVAKRLSKDYAMASWLGSSEYILNSRSGILALDFEFRV